MKEAAEKYTKYSRVAAIMFALEDVLLLSSFVLVVASVVLYLLYDVFYWQLVSVGMAAVAAAYIADRLSTHYYRKALEEVSRLERLAPVAALAIEFDKIVAKLEKEIDELGQELKKMGTV
jgi:hypothetical protein